VSLSVVLGGGVSTPVAVGCSLFTSREVMKNTSLPASAASPVANFVLSRGGIEPVLHKLLTEWLWKADSHHKASKRLT
jgi:hypothetical protein